MNNIEILDRLVKLATRDFGPSVEDLEKKGISIKQIKEDLNNYEILKSDYSYCNAYRRSLMKTIKGNGGCCKNCFWLCKYRDPMCGTVSQYYCSATKWEIEIEENRIDKCICHRFKYDKTQ